MHKTAFIILHYNEIKLTQKAVKSIMEMEAGICDRPIIIVDNCSPNGSGELLVSNYSAVQRDNKGINARRQQEALIKIYVNEASNIHIILNRENSGFARGNNIGYRYVRENMDVDFVVALNNDITFAQKDFVEILSRIYEGEAEEKRFYLAGPDVWTPNIRSHISPLDAKCKDVDDVRRRFDFIEKACETYRKRFDIGTFTRYLQDKYQGSRVLGIYNKLRKDEYDGALKHNQVAYACVLNGACLIFDRRYIREWDYLFDEVTFLYAEEDFLTYRLVKAGKTIRYCPELKVNHVGQGSSGFGGMTYRKYCQKNISTQERIKESFEKYLRLLEEKH